MKSNLFWAATGKTLAVVTVALIVVFVLAPGASAATEKVLYSFTGKSDGETPHGSPVFDSAGNLYGTTLEGGRRGCRYWFGTGCGVVFQLTPNADGSWTENVLYRFKGGADTQSPEWGSLVFDSANNLYGTTVGNWHKYQGSVFELTPHADGSWTERVLHHFTGKNDGSRPLSALTFDQAGNLYGTTTMSGAHGCGTVFEMTPGAHNHWTFRVIHQFNGKASCTPFVGLTLGPDGAFYGTTRGDENCQKRCGTVYKLTPTAGGKWTFAEIHRFTGGEDGATPSMTGPVFDAQGNLYGTVEFQGAYGYGLVYQLAPSAGGTWTYQVLYQFQGLGDGGNPESTMMFDSSGNLYGTGRTGGAYGYGAVFMVTPNQDGTWTESVVHDFDNSDGSTPGGALLWDPAGNLYGITPFGGTYGSGTVYEITP